MQSANENQSEMLLLQGIREIPLGYYRHFKGGLYEVVGHALHSETGEPMVVYRAHYGKRGLWVRPFSMWNEVVERDGAVFRRFTFLGAEPPQGVDL